MMDSDHIRQELGRLAADVRPRTFDRRAERKIRVRQALMAGTMAIMTAVVGVVGVVGVERLGRDVRDNGQDRPGLAAPSAQPTPSIDMEGELIASGTVDGHDWFYGAHLEAGEICQEILIEGPTSGFGSGGCSPVTGPLSATSGTADADDGPSFVAGTVSEEVDRVALRTATDRTTLVDLIAAPAALDTSLRFFISIPLPERAVEILAYGSNDRVLSSQKIPRDPGRSAPAHDGVTFSETLLEGTDFGESWSLSGARDEPLCYEFLMGQQGRLGAVESCGPAEALVSYQIMAFPERSDLIAVAGVVRPGIARLRLRVSGSDRTLYQVELAEALHSGHRVFAIVLQPDEGERPTHLVAFDANGKVIHEERMCRLEAEDGSPSSCGA